MRYWTTLLGACVIAAGMLADAGPSRAGSYGAPTLVELFTSQGCSSCPPADEFVGELARRDGVVALSLHVNYWDYIGWKDPFASDVTTERQRMYGKGLSRGRIYTPQMVIDGVLHEVGSDKAAVLRAIAEARAQERPRLDVDVSLDDDQQLRVSVTGGRYAGAATVWLARYDAEQITRVGRGENAGRTIHNYNVVRDMRMIGTWTGAPLELRLPANMLTLGEGGRDGCAVIVQAEGFGPVLGVRTLALADDSF